MWAVYPTIEHSTCTSMAYANVDVRYGDGPSTKDVFIVPLLQVFQSCGFVYSRTGLATRTSAVLSLMPAGMVEKVTRTCYVLLRGQVWSAIDR